MNSLLRIGQGYTADERGASSLVAKALSSNSSTEFDVASFINKGGLRPYPVLEGMVTSAAVEANRLRRQFGRAAKTGVLKLDAPRHGRERIVSERQQLVIAQAEFSIGKGSLHTVADTLGMNFSHHAHSKARLSFQGLYFYSRAPLNKIIICIQLYTYNIIQLYNIIYM